MSVLAHDPSARPAAAPPARLRRHQAARRRAGAAAGLQRALDDARDRRPAMTSAVPVDGAEVLLAQARLRELIDLLRADRPLPEAVVAQARAILCDGAWPLYRPQFRGALRQAVIRALLTAQGA